MPESLDDIVKTLDRSRPTFTMLYFSASWNPKCAEIERDYENFVNTRGEFTHIKVDCDATPLVKKYFDARVEPQFLFLIKGGEVKRQIGYNFGLLGDIADKIIKTHSTGEFGFYGDTGDQWERFYDEFDRWSRFGEHDRDSLKPYYDFNTDMHRGPGTDNP